MTLWWWDVDEIGLDEIQREGAGMIRFVDGGRRYMPDEWEEADVPFFDTEGTVTILDAPPPDETPNDYPSPAG